MSTAAASASGATRPWRGTIHRVAAPVLAREDHAAGQHVLRLQAPDVARAAEPGAFVHVRCDERLPMRRPMSIMRADPAEGWFEMLFKVVGEGTRALAGRGPGDVLDVLGPIGRGFEAIPDRPRRLLVGGGVGIPPLIFLAERWRHEPGAGERMLVLMGSEVPFPFRAVPSRIVVPGLPPESIAAMPLMEDWGIASRLASASGLAGCHEGFVTELAERWLGALGPAGRAEAAIYACGPTPMLAATARIARHHGVPCRVSLEEYMACAVGGCAGCAVRVRADGGEAMRRVCVDGPVFDAAEVVWR